MSVKINGTEFAEGIVGNNLNQSLSFTEGDKTIALLPITFNNGVNYHQIVNAIFTISGGNTNLIKLKTTLDNFNNLGSNSPIIETTPGVYKISSAYKGFNDYTSLSNTLGTLYFGLNDDASQNYRVDVVLSDSKGNTSSGVIDLEGTGTTDAINIFQTNQIHEDKFNWRYADDGQGLPQVQDQLGPGSGRTYRVTYSPETGGDEQYRIFSSEAGPNGTDTVYSSTVSFEGDENTVNARMASFHIDMGPDWNTDTHIVYTQEVISGAPSVPYVQEVGSLIFSPITADIPGTVAGTQVYNEDEQVAFALATINDSRGTENPDITYNAAITLSDPLAGTLNIGVFDSIDTYNLTNLTKTDMQAELDGFIFTPSADYANNFTINVFLDREQQKGSDTWSDRQVLLDESVQMNIGVVHDEFVLNGPFTYNEDTNLIFTPGQITDLAEGKTYTVNLTLSDPNAGALNISFLQGSRESINLAATNIVFAPSADYNQDFTINWDQQQDTDGIDQGNADIDVNINEVHEEFVLNGPFTYNEDTDLIFTPGQITDLAEGKTYTVTLTLSDPNAGVLSQSVFTDTKDNINTAITNILFTPSADYNQDFTINWDQQQDTDGIDQGNADIAVNGISSSNYQFLAGQPYNWLQNANNVLDVVSITDVATNKQYSVVLEIPNGNIGEFRSFGTGGTSTPLFVEGSGGEITITGTKDQVNSHLETLQFWPYRNYIDAFVWNYNQTQTTDNINQAVAIPVNMNGATIVSSPTNTNINRVYDEDVETYMNDETKTN